MTGADVVFAEVVFADTVVGVAPPALAVAVDPLDGVAGVAGSADAALTEPHRM